MGSKKHLATRHGPACANENVTKSEALTSVPQRVTCVPCRNSSQFIDAIARQMVRVRRPRKATRR